MENQQERTVGLDFIAGLVTGEGSFCLAVQKVAARKGALRITPVFAMFMSDRETIDIVARSLRSHGLPVYLQNRPKAGRDQVGLHISGMKRVKWYCETFIPLLTGQKREAAQLALRFINSRLAGDFSRSKRPYTEKEIGLVRALREVNGNTNGKKTPL